MSGVIFLLFLIVWIIGIWLLTWFVATYAINRPRKRSGS